MAKVKATRVGFFGDKYRRVGDTFECPTEAQFSTKWMELLEGESFDKAKAKKGPKPKAEVIDTTEES